MENIKGFILLLLIIFVPLVVGGYLDTEPVNCEMEISFITDDYVDVIMPDGSVHCFDTPDGSTVADTLAVVSYMPWNEGKFEKYNVVATISVDKLGRRYVYTNYN